MTAKRVWWENVYGKLVREPGGPIVKGYEHRCTGLSPGLPSEIAAQCYPHKTGLGNSDVQGWDGYPWPGSRGGLIVRPTVDSAGEWYLLAGRVRARPEGGEQATHSRLYTQAHYLIAPVKDISDLDLFGLPESLHPEPLTDLDPQRPKVAVPTPPDVPLPNNWLTELRPYLEPLLCGQPVAVQDREVSPEDFFQTALLCLACLPRALRWRLPFGSGLCRITPEVALGHGQTATGGIRRIGKVWKGTEELDHGALQTAQGYLEWLASISSSAETVRNLYDCLDRELEPLSRWDALNGFLNPAASWQDALGLVLERFEELKSLQRLQRWLESGSASAERPQLKHFKNLRPLVVEIIARSALEGGRGGEFLNELLDEPWRAAWNSAGPPSSTRLPLGMLLGILKPFGVEHIRGLLTRELPETVYKTICQTIGAELSKAATEGLRHWPPVIQAAGADGAPAWLKQCLQTCGHTILWSGAAVQATWPDADCFRTWKKSPTVDALRAVLGGKSPSPTDFLKLCDSIPAKAELAIPLLNLAWEKHLYAEAILLNAQVEKLGKRTPLSEELNLARLADSPDRKEISVTAARFLQQQDTEAGKRSDWPEPLLQVVLAFWQALVSTVQEVLKPGVRQHLDPAVAAILFGGSAQDVATAIPPFVGRALQVSLTLYPEVAKRAMKVCGQTVAESPLVSFFTDWFKQQERTRLEKFPPLVYAYDLRHGSSGLLPSLTLDEARTVLHLLKDASRLPKEAPELKGELTAAKLRAYLIAAPAGTSLPKLSDAVAAQCLKLVLTDRKERDFWNGQLRRLRGERQKIWRLLCHQAPGKLNQAPGKLNAAELGILSALDPVTILCLARTKWPLSAKALDRLDAGMLDQARVNDREDLAIVLDQAKKAKSRTLAYAILRHILSLVARGPNGGEELSKLHKGLTKGLLGRLKGLLGRLFGGRTDNGWFPLAQRAYKVAGGEQAKLNRAIEYARTEARAVRHP